MTEIPRDLMTTYLPFDPSLPLIDIEAWMEKRAHGHEGVITIDRAPLYVWRWNQVAPGRVVAKGQWATPLDFSALMDDLMRNVGAG